MTAMERVAVATRNANKDCSGVLDQYGSQYTQTVLTSEEPKIWADRRNTSLHLSHWVFGGKCSGSFFLLYLKMVTL